MGSRFGEEAEEMDRTIENSEGLIRNINGVEETAVEMEGAERVQMALMVGRGDGAPNFALRSFRVDAGGFSPRHSHDFEHEVYVVGGGGEVLLGGVYHAVREGDVVYVPAEEEHQFRAGTEGLRFLCLVPVTRNCGDVTPAS
jgi:quercetin dioxygenase-like cupin family protein